jgi:hypothetical protein
VRFHVFLLVLTAQCGVRPLDSEQRRRLLKISTPPRRADSRRSSGEALKMLSMYDRVQARSPALPRCDVGTVAVITGQHGEPRMDGCIITRAAHA